MSKTIELDVPGRIEAVSKRITHLLETGYLPFQLQDDLRTLMRAALAWDIYSGMSKHERQVVDVENGKQDAKDQSNQ